MRICIETGQKAWDNHANHPFDIFCPMFWSSKKEFEKIPGHHSIKDLARLFVFVQCGYGTVLHAISMTMASMTISMTWHLYGITIHSLHGQIQINRLMRQTTQRWIRNPVEINGLGGRRFASLVYRLLWCRCKIFGNNVLNDVQKMKQSI